MAREGFAKREEGMAQRSLEEGTAPRKGMDERLGGRLRRGEGIAPRLGAEDMAARG